MLSKSEQKMLLLIYTRSIKKIRSSYHYGLIRSLKKKGFVDIRKNGNDTRENDVVLNNNGIALSILLYNSERQTDSDNGEKE